MSFRGKHVFSDFVDVLNPDGTPPDPRILFDQLIAATESSGARIVGTLLEEFDGTESPPGFASVVLIDESHVTAHSYADEGLLALDVFTCGSVDPEALLEIFVRSLRALVPAAREISRQVHDRFPEQ